MSINIIIFGFIIFLFFFVFHIIISNIKKNKSEIKVLFFIYIIIPTVFFIFLLIFKKYSFVFNSKSNIELFSIFILYYAIAFAFIQTYPGFNCEVPSFKILRLLSKNKNGMFLKDIVSNFDDKELLDSRVDLLIIDGLLKKKDNFYILTFKGKILATLFLFYRKILLGLDVGNG